MGAFDYIALDSGGKEKKGVLEGDTPRQIRQQLRDKGLTPLEVQEASHRESKSSASRPKSSLRRGISATDLSVITRQMATAAGRSPAGCCPAERKTQAEKHVACRARTRDGRAYPGNRTG